MIPCLIVADTIGTCKETSLSTFLLFLSITFKIPSGFPASTYLLFSLKNLYPSPKSIFINPSLPIYFLLFSVAPSRLKSTIIPPYEFTALEAENIFLGSKYCLLLHPEKIRDIVKSPLKNSAENGDIFIIFLSTTLHV